MTSQQKHTLSDVERQAAIHELLQEQCQERNKKSPNRRFKKSTLHQLKSPVRFFNIPGSSAVQRIF